MSNSNNIVVNGYPLDSIQQKICVDNHKNVMVVAGAGSGKTTTMIGKIKYLTQIKRESPDKILVISFTNESTNSFKEALSKNNISGIEVLTFHKLALKYIKKPYIVDDYFLDTIIMEYIHLNKYTFKKNIILKALRLNNYNEINIKYATSYFKKIIMVCHCSNYILKDFIKVEKSILNSIFINRLFLLCSLYVVIDLYFLYEEEKNSIGSCDFDDLIIKATSNINNYEINYKYIIVDEYQDTSLIRVNFLKSLINKSNANLTVVGDDYQSIYRFNGCDLSIFLNFKKYFKNHKINKLKRTYRNSQELILISKKFILKNPYQIRKTLKSDKHLDKPIKIVYYNSYNKLSMFNKLVNYVKNNYGNYLILGRNNFDINDYINEKVNYLTVHKSKGLEADNIIIINLENNTFGFPNLSKDNKFERIITNMKEKYPFEEERRLFYVALTRTKNYVFLFVNKNNPSIFIEELLKDYEIERIFI